MGPSFFSAFSALFFATSFLHPINAAAPSYNFTQEAINNGDALAQLAAKALANSKSLHQRLGSLANSTCTPDNVRVRREWRTLSAEDRRAFVAAIECMQSSPSLYEPGVMPAAKTLYDDFVAIHLKQTPVIHRSVRSQIRCKRKDILPIANVPLVLLLRLISSSGIACSLMCLSKRSANAVILVSSHNCLKLPSVCIHLTQYVRYIPLLGMGL